MADKQIKGIADTASQLRTVVALQVEKCEAAMNEAATYLDQISRQLSMLNEIVRLEVDHDTPTLDM